MHCAFFSAASFIFFSCSADIGGGLTLSWYFLQACSASRCLAGSAPLSSRIVTRAPPSLNVGSGMLTPWSRMHWANGSIAFLEAASIPCLDEDDAGVSEPPPQ